MNTLEAVIKYEKQHDLKGSRTCGAACLSMVYRSFGKKIAQDEIWPAIAKPNRFGSLSSTTHLMTRDALKRGIAAVAIQARSPLQALKGCRDKGICAILNHRLRDDAATGHYSVLIDLDDRNVVLHDPLYGPARRLLHSELLQIWKPRFPTCEIAGNVFIALSVQSDARQRCALCNTPFPSHLECPTCKAPICLQPAQILGCLWDDCAERHWERICCPECDHLLSVGPKPPSPAMAGAPVAPGSPETPKPEKRSSAPSLDLNKVFGEVDKFTALILARPGVANHPEIKKQLDHIAASKDKIRVEYADHLARSAAFMEQLSTTAREASEQKEAHRRKLEELIRPLPPLDGDALGQQLLKNIGLIR